MTGMTRRKEIPIALWKRIEPLIPHVKRSPKGGRPRISDQQALNGIIYVLRTGIPWEDLPIELGYGSGMTCWRRLRDWQAAGVWHRLHQVLLAERRRAERLDLSRASLDAASVAAPRGAPTPARTRPIVENSAANGI
jgi:transposase